MTIKNHHKLFLGIVFLVVMFSFVIAGNIDTISFKDKSTQQPLTGVQFLLFTCNDPLCNSIISLVQNLNSGANNFVTYEYASTQNMNYGAYMFKACYLPHEDGYTNSGDGGTFTWTYELQKATSCHSPIDNFSVTNQNFVNEPVVVNMVAKLGADVHSAFTNAELTHVPSGYEDYYSVETKITLEIRNSAGTIVNTQTKTYNILMDTTQNVEFSWTPKVQGDYNIKVKTEITDCQCQSTFEQNSQKNIVVWEARPQNQCYTLINNLKATPEFAKQGDLVNVSFSKISNFADSNFAKTAIPTKASYTITDINNNIVYANTEKINANANTIDTKIVSFNWSPPFAGSFNIKVTGVGDSLLCVGKTNPEDTAILGFFVAPTPAATYQITFIVTDRITGSALNGAAVDFGIQKGTTDSFGKVMFNSASGTFNWVVSSSGYITETGTANVAGNSTISVSLAPVKKDEGGGGGSVSKKVSHTIRNIAFEEMNPPTIKKDIMVVEEITPKESPKDYLLLWILIFSSILILTLIGLLVSVALRE